MPETAPRLLRDFARFWLSKRDGRVMPSFEDLDPMEMPWALDGIFVLRRQADGLFAYTLVGEGVAARLGGALKGKTAFDVFEHEYAEWTEARWQKSATERSASYVHSQHLTAGGVPLNSERLLLPLQGATDRVDTLIGVAAFQGTSFGLQVGGGAQVILETIWTPVESLANRT